MLSFSIQPCGCRGLSVSFDGLIGLGDSIFKARFVLLRVLGCPQLFHHPVFLAFLVAIVALKFPEKPPPSQ